MFFDILFNIARGISKCFFATNSPLFFGFIFFLQIVFAYIWQMAYVSANMVLTSNMIKNNLQLFVFCFFIVYLHH